MPSKYNPNSSTVCASSNGAIESIAENSYNEKDNANVEVTTERCESGGERKAQSDRCDLIGNNASAA